MRKSKYDQSPLSAQDSKSTDRDDNISEIESRVEFDTEFINLTNQIEDIKAAIQELKLIKACVDSSMVALEKSTQALNAAMKKSDNIANAIRRTVIQVENTAITVKLSETDKSILAEYRHKLIEEEKCLFEKQMAELKATHEKHWKEVNRFVKSHTSFSLNGWIAKISVIGFWVLYAYFCLTLGGWVIYQIF
ncbi:hypothetical protein [Culturomica sp.]|uniref:hypothetical protein n=1 Tax=Culturomica sp. TaxID=1926652 RepID=UPI000E9C507A|nr:hypothetical protein [Culturomica sp.]HBO26630.1 hypothetical protein [Culturomica sp.]